MGRIVNLEFRGLHKAFGQLRSADRRSIIAAYRFGQVVVALNATGYKWEEIGDEVDRSWRTIKLYATLYNKYDTEQELIEDADKLGIYNVSKLAGHTSMVPIQYVLHCTNCGSFEVKKERKREDDPPAMMPIVVPKFQAPPSLREAN
jgi:hypothetical protein